MATTSNFFDFPAIRGFGLDLQQLKAVQKALALFDKTGKYQNLYAASGALAVTAGFDVITKTGSLAAMTLAAPTAAQNGMQKTVTSTTAFAHTITATGLFDNGVTGGSKNTATFAAFPGASITIQAINGKWNVIALNAVTVA